MSGDRVSAAERSPWGALVIVVSLVFLLAGVIWPGVADTLLRVFLWGLALGWVAFRGLGAGIPAATMHDSYSPFDGPPLEVPPSPVPDVVRRRARAVAAIDDPRRGPAGPIPWPVAQGLILEVVRRLEKGHGLRPDLPGDAPRIRRLVSDPTWALLGLEARPGRLDLSGPGDRRVPLARLDDILDDLEKL